MITGSHDAGLSVKISCSPRIENNWLAQNPTGVNISYGSGSQLSHNVIADGREGVRLEGNSHVAPSWNVVERQSSAAFSFANSQASDFHRNNILDNDAWHVYLFGNVPGVDARNNWWGTVDRAVIGPKIRDGEDLPQKSKENLGVVRYEPFEVEPLPEAGIEMGSPKNGREHISKLQRNIVLH